MQASDDAVCVCFHVHVCEKDKDDGDKCCNELPREREKGEEVKAGRVHAGEEEYHQWQAVAVLILLR